MRPRTFLDLCFAMRIRAVVSLGYTQTGVIQSIEVDGDSGYDFNVMLQPQDSAFANPIKVFVRMET